MKSTTYTFAVLNIAAALLSNGAAGQQPAAARSGVGAGAALPAVAPPAPAAPRTPEPPEPALFATSWSYDGGNENAQGSMYVPREGSDSKDARDVEEDLNVMAHILEKAAAGQPGHRAMGIPLRNLHFFGAGAPPRNLYIEGFGALFFLDVNFPLNPPPHASDEVSKEEASNEWEDAKQELSSPSPAAAQFGFATSSAAVIAGTEEFDAKKLETLKKDLVAALRNASHIRQLQDDESVVVVVTGKPAPGTARSYSRSNGRPRASSTVRRDGPKQRNSRLVLRVKKSDAQNFSKEGANMEDFAKKVTVFTSE